MNAPRITVVAATDFRLEQHVEAIARTRAALPMDSVGLLIAPVAAQNLQGANWEPPAAVWRQRGQWNRREYSRFILHGLLDHVDTEFVIVVQWDGFGVHRECWSDSFLHCDYIGAPWPRWLNIGRVGNGGFSLRSRRWLECSAHLVACPDFDAPEVQGSEDCYCCTVFREFYLAAGLRVAPLELAMRWSLEHPVEEYPRWRGLDSFGFHGFLHPDNQSNRL